MLLNDMAGYNKCQIQEKKDVTCCGTATSRVLHNGHSFRQGGAKVRFLEIVAQEEEGMKQFWCRLERKGPPKVKTVLLVMVMLGVLCVVVLLLRFIFAEVAAHTGKLLIYGAQPGSLVSRGEGRGTRKSIGMVTAWRGGLHWDILGRMSSDTKAKYAALHGYTFYVDNRMATTLDKSDMRFVVLAAHLQNHSWYVPC